MIFCNLQRALLLETISNQITTSVLRLKRFHIVYFLVVGISCFAISFGQTGNPSIDSILQKAKAVSATSSDSAYFYSNKAYEIALVAKDSNAIYLTEFTKASFLLRASKNDEAYRLLLHLLQNKEALSVSLLADVYYHVGTYFYYKEQYDLSLENYLLAVEHFGSAENKRGMAKANLQIGVIYDRLGKQIIAKYFFEASLTDSSNSSAHSPDKIYVDDNTLATERIASLTEMIKELESNPNNRLKGEFYYNKGRAYSDLNDYRNALDSYLRSLAIKKEIQSLNNIDKTYIFIGENYLRLGETAKAIPFLLEGIQTTNKKQEKLKANQLLKELYSSRNDFENALHYSEVSRVLQDSINQLQENDRIAEITSQYETEKQAAQIELLESDNKLTASKLSNQKNILWATIIGVLLLLTALYFAYNRRKTKQKLAFSEMTRKLLQMQLNPHFLFNALNGIQNFIKQNDVKKSSKYISNFSGLMRNILENSVEKFISIEEDGETISDFLALQQLVNGNSFSYEVTFDENLDPQNMCIPPMFTQPFVENAIIHGVQGIENGVITVSYALIDDHIQVAITDNGRGLKAKSNHANSLHKSMGTSITKQRMENLLRTENYPITLELRSKNDENEEQETQVFLTFLKKFL